MNKSELVQAVAEKTDMSRTDATRATDALLESITEALKNNEEVRLVGFGTFGVVHRKATTGRNPQTGEAIELKASNQPKFKPGKGLKEAVN